jgi:osmotically-inducible protein OsmY
MASPTVEADVRDELLWDPKIDNEAVAAAVAADGAVTLRGTVGSFRQKQEAAKAVQRVRGVTSVDNQLEVRLLTDHRRDDAELRGDVLQALMLDSLIPSTVDAFVKDGVVTLNGTADWQYQRGEAEIVAANVLGVVGVEDGIYLNSLGPHADDVEGRIADAMQRDAKLDADDVTAAVDEGVVTLKGTVRSWAERDAAVAAAWAAPGTLDVVDDLNILY